MRTFRTIFSFWLLTATALTCPPIEKIGAENAAHLHEDLATYIAGMNKSSLQKAVFAMLARSGRVADLGAGSGITSHDLAVLMPNSKIIGVDLDPHMVEHARKTYPRENLEFREGNAEKPNFPDASLDALFMSSTAHHLTSYGEGDFDIRHVQKAFDEAVRVLKQNGVYVVRDFVIPDGPKWVHLELPANDGSEKGTPVELSTAALFEKFAKDFRSSQHPRSGVEFSALPSSKKGWKKYRVSHRDAAEFILRKDYRAAYDAEIKEEYTFLSQTGYEKEFQDRGLRILHSGPIHNPWIVSNRYDGKVSITNEAGETLPFPPTNFVIVGQKVSAKEGVSIREVSSKKIANPSFISLSTMRDMRSGRLVDIVRRPFGTRDILPFWTNPDGSISILAKQGFPRPIGQIQSSPSLSKVRSSGYRVEPTSFIESEAGFQNVERNLLTRAGIEPSRIRAGKPVKPFDFYSSPGNVDEHITSHAVEIDARDLPLSPQENYSGFSTSGDVRPFDAQKVLHSAQAGSILDARLEIGVYNLLLDRKKSVGPWIGDEIKLSPQEAGPIPVRRANTLLSPKNRRRAFVPETSDKSAGFLEVRKGEFEETDRYGNIVAKASREYVVPTNYSDNVVSSLPVFRHGNQVLVGLESRDLPAVQLSEGYSDIITNPAFRLSKGVEDSVEAEKELGSILKTAHNLTVKKSWGLGGPYQSSIGVTPETVYPRVVEVEVPSKNSNLRWVNLKDLVSNRGRIKDGHLMIIVHRLAHALGYLP